MRPARLGPCGVLRRPPAGSPAGGRPFGCRLPFDALLRAATAPAKDAGIPLGALRQDGPLVVRAGDATDLVGGHLGGARRLDTRPPGLDDALHNGAAPGRRHAAPPREPPALAESLGPFVLGHGWRIA